MIDSTIKPSAPGNGPVLITGGAGFVGINLAKRLLDRGEKVLLYDNLSRPGVEKNLSWIQNYSTSAQFTRNDVRDRNSLAAAVAGASFIYHFAAQVAVTTSLVDPVSDFEVNVGGTLNLLEILRQIESPPPMLYTSTNKVFGALEGLDLIVRDRRYAPADPEVALRGVSESQPLAFYSPYGCSKGAADQYVLDYARHYGLKAVVFRMSCIYGPHQFGTEDQGWVAHFILCAIQGRPLVLYGDGKQVRDLLYVEDLVDALLCARANMDALSGRAFAIGGGTQNSVSLLELIEDIHGLHGAGPPISHAAWRPGDQKYYVADTSVFRSLTGWTPKVGVKEGVRQLYEWLRKNRTETGGF